MIFLKGLALGLAIAAPVGPIAVLCIQRTLEKGRRSGFFSGLGAATADALYGSIAAFSLTIISDFLIEYQLPIRLIGGLFLLYIGITTYLSKPKESAIKEKSKNPLTDYISTLLLTITNPMTIISFAALFVGIGFGFDNADLTTGIVLVLGVFIGSAAWWLVLTSGISAIKQKNKNIPSEKINKISGIIIVIFALIILAKLINL